jgi:hypothetical protein
MKSYMEKTSLTGSIDFQLRSEWAFIAPTGREQREKKKPFIILLPISDLLVELCITQIPSGNQREEKLLVCPYLADYQHTRQGQGEWRWKDTVKTPNSVGRSKVEVCANKTIKISNSNRGEHDGTHL